MEKLISVVIPCYNCGDTVQNAIASVYAGSYKNVEVLVYDDGSVDDTRKILYHCRDQHERLYVYYNAKNKGAGVARNYLLSKVNGEIIAFLDADDVWTHNKLTEQVIAMNEHKADIVCSSYKIINRKKVLGFRNLKKRISFIDMHFANEIPTSFTIFKASLIKQNLMPSIRLRQDYGFWLRLFQENPDLKCIGLAQYHGSYLKQDNSLSSSPVKNLRYNYEVFRVIMKYNIFFSIIFVVLNILTKVIRSIRMRI